MNRKTRIFIMILQFFGLFFVMQAKVYATAPVITSVSQRDGDLFVVNTQDNGGTITAYLFGTTINNAESVSANANNYISLPNGTFYIWAKNSAGEYSAPYQITVTSSCSTESATNKTDTGSIKICYKEYTNGTRTPYPTGTQLYATCAPGYSSDVAYSTWGDGDCGKKMMNTGLSYRFCQNSVNYKCTKTSSDSGNNTSNYNSKLSALSISSGTLTPSFSPSTYTYSATTSASSITINATLANSGASFVNGFGNRTVNLNYGSNTVLVKTTHGNTESTYTLNIKRTDNRSSVNTLSSLTVSNGTLSPSFKATTVNYTVSLEESVTQVAIGANLTDSKSSFVNGYGPRTISTTNASTKATIKVKSESGNVRTYTITFKKPTSTTETETTPTPDPEPTNEDVLLKSLVLSSGTIDFDSKTFDYNVSVDYEITNIKVEAEPLNDGDIVNVTGGDNLEADTLNEIKIEVTSSTDENKKSIYTIYVTRKNENVEVSKNSLLHDLQINGYSIKFDAKDTDYEITLKNGETELDITATPDDEKSTITIEGNENLVNNSKIKIRVTAEDGSYTDYYITTKVIKNKGNAFLTIVVVILIILVLGYLVLRAMGYKIYFNLDAIKSLFNRKKD